MSCTLDPYTVTQEQLEYLGHCKLRCQRLREVFCSAEGAKV